MYLAHGFEGRTDLPVPFWLAVGGAALAVIVSFVALGMLWPSARLQDAPTAGKTLPRLTLTAPVTAGLRWTLRLVVLAFSAVLVTAAFAGSINDELNPLAWWLYIGLWIGVVPLSLLFGPVWRAVNPIRTLQLLAAKASGSDPEEGISDLPESWGYWPAAAWLTGFAWLELVYPYSTDPVKLGIVVVTFGFVNFVAASIFGGRWLSRADPFEVYSDLIGALSPLTRRDDGRFVLRNPLRGIAAVTEAPGLVAVVCVLLGSTAFDGVTRTTWWVRWTGTEGGWATTPANTLGFVVCIALVGATYVAATRLAGRGADGDPRGLPTAFAHSVIPIAVGYAIAHYATLLLLEGQNAYIVASDPFDTGANWFGTANWTVNYDLLSARFVANLQIGAIVGGHVLGVVAAHDRAVATFRGRAAVTGQYPLLAVMVLFTLAGVGLLLG